MSGEPIEPAELLQAEWPAHLLGEILNRLLGEDVITRSLVLPQRARNSGADDSFSSA